MGSLEALGIGHRMESHYVGGTEKEPYIMDRHGDQQTYAQDADEKPLSRQGAQRGEHHEER